MVFPDDMYLNDILRKYSPDYQNEQDIRNYIFHLLRDFAYRAKLYPSGSQAKGTGINLISDFDYLLSIDDDNDSLKDLYDYTYEYLLHNLGRYNVKKQNVSIGFNLLDTSRNKQISVDITPARKHPGNTYDHSIYVSKKRTWQKTNVQKHIKDISESGRTNEIKLLKIWRFKESLDFPSIYLEYLIIDILRHYQIGQLAKNIRFIFANLAGEILDKSLCDPANSNNMLSELVEPGEKEKIKRRALLAAQANLQQVFGL